jgi:hypothetical protein
MISTWSGKAVRGVAAQVCEYNRRPDIRGHVVRPGGMRRRSRRPLLLDAGCSLRQFRNVLVDSTRRRRRRALLLDALSHERAAIVALRHQCVMFTTQQLDIVGGRGAPASVGCLVMKLEHAARQTAPAVRAHEAALLAVAGQHLAAHAVRNVPRIWLAGLIGRRSSRLVGLGE